MDKVKYGICTVTGAVGSVIVNTLGGWSNDLKTLVMFMIIDFIMGLMIAFVFKKSTKTMSGRAESNTLFKGICKKTACLFFVLIAYRIDVTFDLSYVRTAVVIGFIINELVSIIENAGLMGISLPKVIVDTIDVLQKKTEKM